MFVGFKPVGFKPVGFKRVAFKLVCFKTGARMNPGKSANASATKQAHQDCFGLIVERMRSRDLYHSAIASQLPEKVIALLARFRLNARIVPRIHRSVTSVQFKAMLPRQRRDKPLVAIRFLTAAF